MLDSHTQQQSLPRWASFGWYHFDLELHQLYRGEQRIPLQAQAGQILGILIRHQGELVSREQISREIWADRQVDFEASLNTAIRAIRRALEDDAIQPDFIETVPRRGYRFLHSTKLLDSRPGKAETSSASLGINGVIYQHRKIGFAATCLVIFLAAIIYFMLPQGSKTQSDNMKAYVTSPGYENFLHGRYAQSQGEREKAKSYLEAAIKADPKLAPAYVSLSRINIGSRKMGWDKILEARGLVEQALQIDGDLAAAHVLKAGITLYYWRDHTTARQYIANALAIAPNDPDALVVKAYLNVIQGNSDIALSAIAKAHQLRPLSPSLNADYGWVLYKAGNWNEAERMCKTSVELKPNSQFALSCVIHINHSQGDHAEAAEFGSRLMALRGATPVELDEIRAVVDAKAREAAFWNWTLNWLNSNKQVSDRLSKTGITLTMLGQYDRAIATFEQAFEKNGEPFLAFFAVDPRVADLQNHLGFEKLAEHSRKPLSRD